MPITTGRACWTGERMLTEAGRTLGLLDLGLLTTKLVAGGRARARLRTPIRGRGRSPAQTSSARQVAESEWVVVLCAAAGAEPSV